MDDDVVRAFVTALPKAELHLHIEGTLEPELMFELADRNGVTLPYASLDQARAARRFFDLQSFLDVYYAACAVLVTADDFFELAWAYLVRAHADGVVHAELSFDPQTHTARGIEIGIVVDGLTGAMQRAEREWGMTGCLIMCVLRHLPADEALAMWGQAAPHLAAVRGLGLDSGEAGNPPERFAEVYRLARVAGLRLTAHAGEEGPADYVRDSLDVLGVERIDHGVHAIDDPALVDRLAAAGTPLTMCPLSNQRLQVTPDLRAHPLKRLLDAGVLVTVNSDDPAYFGGYLVDNYVAIAGALHLTTDDLRVLAAHSMRAAWRG